jgi:hypothetical protein
MAATAVSSLAAQVGQVACDDSQPHPVGAAKRDLTGMRQKLKTAGAVEAL